MSNNPPTPFTLCGHDFGASSFISLSQGDKSIQRFDGGELEDLYPAAIAERDHRNAEIGVTNALRIYWEKSGPGGTWENRQAPPKEIWPG